jgi:hypothetical protein
MEVTPYSTTRSTNSEFPDLGELMNYFGPLLGDKLSAQGPVLNPVGNPPPRVQSEFGQCFPSYFEPDRGAGVLQCVEVGWSVLVY